MTPLKRKKPVVVKLPRTNLAAEDEAERPLWVARVASAEDLEVVSEAIAEEPETFGREISPGELEDQQSELMTLEVYLPGKRWVRFDGGCLRLENAPLTMARSCPPDFGQSSFRKTSRASWLSWTGVREGVQLYVMPVLYSANSPTSAL